MESNEVEKVRFHIISRKMFRNFVTRHPEHASCRETLYRWAKLAETSGWKNFADVRRMFGSVDRVGDLAVFNIAGHKVRLIIRINFKSRRIYVRHVFTHEEYDREDWRE